jgi:DNA-binding transcriptional ArsR family regulator
MGRRGAQRPGTDDDTVVIRDVKTLKALADPLRHELLALLDAPRTVRELAGRLGRPPDRLYYHLGLLERHGLITAVEERGAERRYRLAAQHLLIDPDLTMPPGVASGLVGSILQRVHREYAAAARLPRSQGKKRSTIAMQHIRLTEEQRADLAQRLLAILREYEDVEPADGIETENFGVIVGLWPVADQ